MILSTLMTMFMYEIMLGGAISIVLVSGLYFAKFCECVVDFFIIRK